MRELKIRYTYKRKEDGKIYQEIVPIECLEGRGDKPLALDIHNPYWDIIARDFYTGLKDKNGTEIYEGDILLIPDEEKERILDDGSGPTEPFNHLAPVTFENGTFGLQVAESGEIFDKKFWSFEHIEWESGALVELEVIGNLYESPALLTP